MRRAALIGATCAVFSVPAAAQELTVLVGGVRARYADSVSGSALLTSLRLAGYSPNIAGVLNAGVSKFVSGEWVSQLSAHGTALVTVIGGLKLGVASGASMNRLEDDLWVGDISAGPLLAFTSGRFLGTAGVAMGAVRTIGDTTIGSTTLNARLRHELSDFLAISAGGVAVRSDTTSYADFTADLSYANRRITVAVMGGVRAGDLEDNPWVQGRIDFILGPRAALEAAVGRYPRDLQGFTDGLFGTLGVRLSVTNAAVHRSVMPQPVSIQRIEDGRVRISIAFKRALERLEIAGDWNGWEPIALRRDGDRWTVELLLDPGIHRYSLVVDGTTWTVPQGVPTEPDDFGGQVALLVAR